jgi:hypothetical protein
MLLAAQWMIMNILGAGGMFYSISKQEALPIVEWWEIVQIGLFAAL